SASHSCGKRATAERLYFCLRDPTPKQFHIPFPSPARSHPASLSSGSTGCQVATKGYKSLGQIPRCSGSLLDNPRPVATSDVPENRGIESTDCGYPVQSSAHHFPAHHFLPPSVGRSNRSHSPAG